jgi:hypothetical protein
MLSEFYSRGRLWQVNIGIIHYNLQFQAFFVKVTIELHFKNLAHDVLVSIDEMALLTETNLIDHIQYFNNIINIRVGMSFTCLCACFVFVFRVCVCVHVYGIFHIAHISPFPFLGALAKLRKATISFVMAYLSVLPSACNSSAPTRRIVMKVCVLVFFENLS